MFQLRILHIALALSAVAITLTLGLLRPFGPVGTMAIPSMLEWTLLGLSAVTILSGAALRTRIPAQEAAVSKETWVAENKVKCVMLWAVLEGGVSLCAVCLFLGGNPLWAGAMAAGGLGFLASQSPGTLAGH